MHWRSSKGLVGWSSLGQMGIVTVVHSNNGWTALFALLGGFFGKMYRLAIIHALHKTNFRQTTDLSLRHIHVGSKNESLSSSLSASSASSTDLMRPK